MAFLETSIYQRQVEFSLKNVNQDQLFKADRQSNLLSIEQEYIVTRFGSWAAASGCSLVAERKHHNQEVMGSNPAGCGAFSVLFLSLSITSMTGNTTNFSIKDALLFLLWTIQVKSELN